MATYNKSEIMTMAWKYVKVLGISLSQALKDVWYAAKKKIERNTPKVKSTSWYKAPPKTIAVNCPNQGNFEPMIKRYASTIAR